MKRFNFLPVVVMAVLMVFAVGCTTLYEGAGGYEEMPQSRTYRQVPYGNTNVIVVERDPFTGRYYEVSPYGNYGTPYRSYGYGYPSSPRVSNRGGYYRNNPGGRTSGGNQVIQKPQQQNRSNESTQKARDILKGN